MIKKSTGIALGIGGAVVGIGIGVYAAAAYIKGKAWPFGSAKPADASADAAAVTT